MDTTQSASPSKPLKLSWSRLRIHDECPERGMRQREGQKYPLTDYRNFFPGTVTDQLMRQWLHQEPPQRGWMATQVDRVMDATEKGSKDAGDGVVRWKHLDDRNEVRELCRAAVTQLEKDLVVLLGMGTDQECNWDPACRFEVPITIPYRSQQVQIYLIGEMDLLLERNNGFAVYDLKTTRDDQYWRKTLGQLLFYEIAVYRMKKVWPTRSGLLQPLVKDTQPYWEFGEDDRRQMLIRIVSTATAILDRNLPPKPGAQCKYCDVRHACSVKGGGRGRVQGWGR